MAALSPRLLWEFMLPAALLPLPCFLGNAEAGTEASGRVSIELHTCELQEGPERESAIGSLRERERDRARVNSQSLHVIEITISSHCGIEELNCISFEYFSGNNQTHGWRGLFESRLS